MNTHNLEEELTKEQGARELGLKCHNKIVELLVANKDLTFDEMVKYFDEMGALGLFDKKWCWIDIVFETINTTINLDERGHWGCGVFANSLDNSGNDWYFEDLHNTNIKGKKHSNY